ncbi:RNA-binding protein, CCR4-NOT complex subunit Rcd1 [Entomophthora muscae]|uniref:RNA-binding protein, CCR4-NOT complex subunit Rcd1 n=2 Tax=Entomophthora muscae TaxID=34485 RepID=A0ACC2T8T6_9FUNG|nr:RNA-binding protein, CCR4-NOT complex subunit Rcd1 [Entomophthora muscae]KAJ9079504.1 RNA-binding protein, CCR4-NOT complex subunit Rcd1 [Entomophthora muscae]
MKKMHSYHQNINDALLQQYLQQQSQVQGQHHVSASGLQTQQAAGLGGMFNQLSNGNNEPYFYPNPSISGGQAQNLYSGQQHGANLALNAVANQPYRVYSSEDERVYSLVMELLDPLNRGHALAELSRHRDEFENLALILWHSFGVMACLIQELLMVYPLLYPPNLKEEVALQVCNVLALMQVVASHTQTRMLFISAHIPLLLFPFLNTTTDTKSFEHLRLTSLGVIGALVKHDNPEITQFLLNTETMPLCLRIMETSTELSKTVAIFIIQKIITDKVGLDYVCHSYDRFVAIAKTLSIMVFHLIEKPSSRLLKHVVKCYLRLAENPSARHYLQQQLPEPLRDATFSQVLKDDATTKHSLASLLLLLANDGHLGPK